MSLSLLDAQTTVDGIRVRFLTDNGVESLEGSAAEIARLAEVMAQLSVLAPLNDGRQRWIEDVVVGNATVRLGLGNLGQGRVRIDR